jgi:hypothetical protein
MAAVGTAIADAAEEVHQGESRQRRATGRRCLACRRVFPSSGAAERICSPCKDSEDWADAVAATKGHIAWRQRGERDELERREATGPAAK